jgi:predicted metal-dependent phosphotriesterase family hydrolase
MTTVETALGPVATAELGPTLMHEHIVTRSPGVHENWPHLFDRDAILALAERKMADLHRRGIHAIVDLTTVDLGRDIDLIAAVARCSPVHVIVATGVWAQARRSGTSAPTASMRWPSCSSVTSPRVSAPAGSRRPSSSAPRTPPG